MRFTEEQKDKHQKLIDFALLGDAAAKSCLVKIIGACRAIDNVVDSDERVLPEFWNDVIANLMFDLSNNPFYEKNREAINAIMFISWNCWMDANEWAKSDESDKKANADVIRNYINELTIFFSWKLGGREHARAVSRVLREFYLREV